MGRHRRPLKLTADGARVRIQWIGGADDLSSSLDDVFALPDHTDNRSTGKEVSEAVKERFARQIRIVPLSKLLGWMHHLHGDQEETSTFESVDDGADETTLDAIRLDLNT